jgi:hypothetical protein
MRFALRFLPVILALACMAMSRKHATTIRFFAEANPHDTASFAAKINVGNPPRETYIEKIPSISEHNIKAFYPFKASDDSWGAYFQLDQKGRIDLEVVSTERRGSSLIAFVGTDKGVHQVIDMMIDKPIRDGIIAIPRGLTDGEIKALSKEYPVIRDDGSVIKMKK